MLIDGGAALNVADEDGETPLHRACWEGHGSIVRMLIDGGADLNVAGIDGLTPLHMASGAGHESIARMLIDRGADLNVADARGWTPLHEACSSVDTHGIREASLEIIRVLILAGADTQARDIEGRLPVEFLPAGDRQSRVMYEEAVVELDSQALRPVLK
jgi:ankyrin repeat protein